MWMKGRDPKAQPKGSRALHPSPCTSPKFKSTYLNTLLHDNAEESY